MATTFRVLGQRQPAATTLSDIYAVPSGNSAIISTVNVCNQSNGISTFRLAIRPANAAISGVHYVAYDTPISPNDSLALTMGMTLAQTDVVTVYSNSGAASFAVFGSELY
jgi:hypothetical protein